MRNKIEELTLRADQQITIVIPTTCDPVRESALVRALASLQNQTMGVPSIVVVANGPHVDERVLQRIGAMPGVQVRRIEAGSAPRAIALGRHGVTTPYFGFLDDDDEYLPDALSVRFQALERDADAAVCATDGYDFAGGEDRLREAISAEAQRDPLRGLLQANWLASCGGLFRSALVSAHYFDGETRFYEWTLLAYQLAASTKILLLNTPTFRLHPSLGSLSRSEAYRLAEPDVLRKICRLNLPEDVQHALRRRLGTSYHSIARYFGQTGRRRYAWRYHGRSLIQPGGWRYALYSVKLFKFWA